ncbi:MAG: polysaccharide pyruvyl transferase family protein [Clostridia bacterium]|nr:polysaccharide pyruvyl transferase family protein [Clostridia bacterium]
MKYFGVVSYNIYGNFTNYGSALQSWALCKSIDSIGGKSEFKSVLVDYCPDVLADKDPLDPMKNMWDKDEESRRQCELSLPAIRINYKKFMDFYNNRFRKSQKSYTSANFNEVAEDEKLDGFVCGSDTIFCIDEFKGFDDGYYANYDCMKNGYTVSYAASFGDPHFTDETLLILNERIKNFKVLGIRENLMVPYLKQHTDIPVQKVLDPTLILTAEDYKEITAPKLIKNKYILLYARRHNQKMTDYVNRLAEKTGYEIVEISLRAENAKHHRMFYEAGVEEFLSLVKYAEYVVTNSFHAAIFSIHFERPFYIFSREQCDTKIIELLELVDLKDRLMVTGEEDEPRVIDYGNVKAKIEKSRMESIKFLSDELYGCK